MPPAKPKQLNVLGTQLAAGMKVKKAELEAHEDEQEKGLRLHKERLTFYFKELVPFTATIVIIMAAAIISLVVIMKGSSPEEKEWAKSVLTAILGGAVGMLFGKQLGK